MHLCLPSCKLLLQRQEEQPFWRFLENTLAFILVTKYEAQRHTESIFAAAGGRQGSALWTVR